MSGQGGGDETSGMKVLLINQSDIYGGAAIAAYRLHQGLLAQGVDSRLLVGSAETDDPRVSEVPRYRFIETQLFRVCYLLGLNYLNYLGTFQIPKHPFFQEADIVHFNNLHTGYFNYLAIPRLTNAKPTVFTLHDMWSFTGRCAYSFDCDRWKRRCGHCPYPGLYPNVLMDNTWLEWKLKNFVYRHSKLALITPSQWLAEQVRQSMLNRFMIHRVPYGIDTELFQPLDREKCRYLLGIPSGKKVLMFGAERLKNPRKGGDLLLKALKSLPASLKTEIMVVTFGHGGKTTLEGVDIPLLNLGYVSSDRIKVVAFSAADLLIFPTRADNLPIVIQESMACGIPVVSCDVGGVSDMVIPGRTGYLARAEDAEDLARGILELLEDDEMRRRLGREARRMAVERYSLERVVQQHLNIYRQVLKE